MIDKLELICISALVTIISTPGNRACFRDEMLFTTQPNLCLTKLEITGLHTVHVPRILRQRLYTRKKHLGFRKARIRFCLLRRLDAPSQKVQQCRRIDIFLARYRPATRLRVRGLLRRSRGRNGKERLARSRLALRNRR